MKNLKREEVGLLDIDFFQKIQDRLSDEFGIASIITDIDGNPLTKSSNFSSFCTNHIRNSPQGLKNCKLCDAIGGLSAKKHMKPVIYSCHSGLTDFASPIIVNGELVGCFLCGQILTNNLPDKHFQKIANELNLNLDSLEEALKEVRVLPFEKVEYFANFLFEISTKISDFSYYQNIGKASTKTLEDDLNTLFSIINNNTSCDKKNLISRFMEKIKLTFSIKSVSSELIYQNIENLNHSFSYINIKIKEFNKKIKNF